MIVSKIHNKFRGKKTVHLIFILVFAWFFFSAGWVRGQERQWEPDWDMLRSRPYPQWFSDAKLGIFIHWGVYSVPAYGGPESYAEWYLRGLQTGHELRTDFMKDNYGEDFTYRDFAPLLKAELFDADEWAQLFKRAGARYIILVSKHHDGYCLWPSEYAPGWNSVDVGPGRDITGELADAVRKRDINFGLYYSLPEWNNPLHRWYTDPHDQIHEYVEKHMIPQFKEVVGKYRPKVLFTDGEWYNSAEDWKARELISWYYNLVGDKAIVNDRWGHGSNIGFITPEYSSGALKTDRPWAEVRGIGRSFGLNRNEKLEAYKTPEELIHFFVSLVANGGGLTLNVGPGADGQIPLIQQERLIQLGDWIMVNEEAIYGSTPWIRSGEQKEVTLERVDEQIAFNWVRNSPGYPVTEDHFTGTWTGYIMPGYSEEYEFIGRADDGMRLFIGDKLVLDQWGRHSDASESEAMRNDMPVAEEGRIRLEKGRKYPIRIEYYETVQNASIFLSWKSKSQQEEIIPKKNLFTSAGIEEGDGLNAVYRSMRQYMAYTTNNGNLYAISYEWPRGDLVLPIHEPPADSAITLLGHGEALPWRYSDGALHVDLSPIGYNQMPGHHAWTFRIENYR
jgi:alpha-L-fucosidase